MTLITLLLVAALLAGAAWFQWPAWAALIAVAAAMTAGLWLGAGVLAVTIAGLVALPLLAAALVPLRRSLVSRRVHGWFRRVMPTLSDTEREALESGSVWWDAELFSGRPRWSRLLDAPAPALSEREQAFLDGPVDELCALLDEWDIQRRGDLPPEAWELLRRERFFSMIIPAEYGGLDFSAQGNAAVVTRIASRNQAAATTVMVPNSLGPGELLQHFGTPAQKDYHLPRLASGEDIPCFALTSPLAGSDAASMPDTGVVCRRRVDGEEVLGFLLNFDKRYITLAPVATLIGLAFKARDPDGLLGGDTELGITCALIPADIPGIEVGRRHIPGGAVFMNGPVRGTDVFIPFDRVIGGPEYIGRGWSMLMQCLAAGRAISLPALSVANVKMAALMTGAYARVRRQFKQPIGYFEGIEEPLARIGGEAYRAEAAHRTTLAALDAGERPAVLSAILKANLTEANRRVLNDAMDVHGGKTVIEGPRNYLACAFQSIPVAITVEGANILTRSMIIFGQGAIRCHPWLLKEMKAAGADTPEALRAFDRALFGHIGFVLSNLVRAPLLAVTGGRLSPSPVDGPAAPACRHIQRLSAAFALIADLALLRLGGKFKFAEKLSGRFADAISHLYMASCTIKRFIDDGQPEEDLPLVQWAVADSLHRVEEALLGILAHFPGRITGGLLRIACFPLGRRQPGADDHTGRAVARVLLDDNPARDRLTRGVFRPRPEDGAGVVLEAFAAVLASAEPEQAVTNAFKRAVTPVNARELTAEAVAAGVITGEQAEQVCRAQALIAEAIAVDEFEPEEIRSGQRSSEAAGVTARAG